MALPEIGTIWVCKIGSRIVYRMEILDTCPSRGIYAQYVDEVHMWDSRQWLSEEGFERRQLTSEKQLSVQDDLNELLK